MMKRLLSTRFCLTLLFLTGLALPSLSQERAQWRQQLEKQLPDTARTSVYLKLANSYLPQETDSAAIWVDRATKSIGNGDWPKGYARTLTALTEAYGDQSAYEKSNVYANIVIQNYDKYTEFKHLFDAKQRLANNYSEQGSTDTAIAIYNDLKEALAEQQFESPEEEARMYISFHNGLGMAQAISGDVTTSLSHFLSADSIAELRGTMMDKMSCKSMLGTLYLSIDLEQSIALLQEVDRLYLKEQTAFNITNVYSNLATAHIMLGKYDEARVYLDKNLIEGRKHKDSITVGFVYINLGNIDQDLGNYSEANKYFRIAASVFGSTGNASLQNAAKFEYVRTCMLGKIQLEESIVSATELLDYYYTQKDLDKIADIYRVRAEIYYALGDYQLGFHDIDSNDFYNKLRSDKTFNEQVAKMKTQYDTDLHKRQSTEQAALAEASQRESESKTVLLLIVGGAALLLSLVLVGLVIALKRLRQSRAQIDAQKSNIERREREKTILLKELHHRVKNNLQIVSSLLNLQADTVQDEVAQSAFRNGQNRVEAMAMIHRYLYATDELTTLEVKSYLTQLILSIAHSYGYSKTDLDLNLDITDKPIDVDLAIPLGLIANELVSNAFKHAFKETSRAKLLVSLKLDKDLVLKVCDNGPGKQEKAPSENAYSFGMELVQSLSKQLKAELNYSFKDGACFQLVVPEDVSEKAD